MVAIGDVARFTVKSIIAGEECITVDFKKFETLPPNPMTPLEIAVNYHARYDGLVNTHLSNECELQSVLYENLTNGLEFAEYVDPTVGGQSGQSMPSFVAIKVRLNRNTKLTRNGAKRIAGIPEARVADNLQSLAANSISNIEAFYGGSVFFNDVANPPDQYTMGTVIVGRTLNAQGVYELDLTRVNDVSSAAVDPFVTTQNTRKPS